MILGKQSDAWQVDALLLQPILRDDNGFDKRDKANTLIGAIGDYRGISQYITLQPLYLVLKQDGTGSRVVTLGAGWVRTGRSVALSGRRMPLGWGSRAPLALAAGV